MARSTTRRRLAAALAGLCLAGLARPTPLLARPYGVEDFLAHESLGPVSLSPDGGWLAVDWRGPRGEARRFDYDLLNDWFRTTVMVADLRTGGPLRPLFAPEPATGYRSGPLSPDGRRLAVLRLKDDQLTLGVADLASGELRWLPVHPDYDLLTRTIAWTSATRLAVIAHPAGSTPWYVRAMHPWTQLPPRWAQAAAGMTATTTVYGSGEQAADMDPPPALDLVEADAVTGQVRPLARGAFADLEASADGRLAVLERGELVRWQAGAQVQGDYGVATRRMRLRLVDLATGALTTPCPTCDVMGGPLAWSPSGARLLAYVRQDGQPWTGGRLLAIDGRTGALTQPAAGLDVSLARRPEVARAAWWGETPLVFGRPAGEPAARDDWWRLTPQGPRKLTTDLPAPTADLALASLNRLLVRTAEGWRAVAADGRPRPLPAGAELLRPSRHMVQDRAWSLPADPLNSGLATPSGGGLALHPLTGADAPLPIAPGVQVLRLLPGRGALLAEPLGGGAQQLVWRAPHRSPSLLARLNPQEANLTVPVFRPVRHTGPSGEPRTSWLLLPQASRATAQPAGHGARQASDPAAGPGEASGPPLIVWPYPGSALASVPASLDLTDDAGDKTPLMLAGHGYAVLLPSLPNPPAPGPGRLAGPGPGEGLAQRVLGIVDAAARQPDLAGAFDPDQLGLVGFSHGGYAVNAIVTQTGRFKAAVAAGSSSNLSSMWGVLSDPSRISPERGSGAPWMAAWTESVQGMMYAPPWADPDRYVRNSPLFHAGAVTTPLLLLQGEQDSQPHAEAERMYSALERQGKAGELVTYWGEGHILYSPANLRDYVARIFRWLDPRLGPGIRLAVAATEQGGSTAPGH